MRAVIVGAFVAAAALYSGHAKAACSPGQLNAAALCDCPPGYTSVGNPGKARCQAQTVGPDTGKGGKVVAVVNAKCKPGDLDGCKKQCDQKNSGSCVILGRMYKTGEGVSLPDREMAYGLFKKACDAGDQPGCVEQARMLEAGSGVSKDVDKAVRLYGRACDAKNAEGCSELGANYFSGDGVPKDANKGVQFQEKACTYKDYASCNRVGVIYYDGTLGITTDEEKATKLFAQACDNGEATACSNLANAYEDGRGVPKDLKRTINLAEKSCNLGFAAACNGLGLRYARAQGVEKDWKQAYKFFEKSCDGGQRNGCHNAGYCLENGEGVAKDETASAARYDKACKLGDADSCYSLAEQYFDGRGVIKSDTKAAPLYKSACDGAKHGEACRGYGFLLWEGRGVEKDLALSVSYNKKGCDADVGGACYNVGVSYQLGGGVSKDIPTARTYFEKGCKLKNQPACLKLSSLDSETAKMSGAEGSAITLAGLGVTLKGLPSGGWKTVTNNGSDGKSDLLKRDQNPMFGVLVSKQTGRCADRYSPKAGVNTAKYSPAYLPGGWDTRTIETIKPDSDGDMLTMTCADLPNGQLLLAIFSYRGSLESSDFTGTAKPILASLIEAVRPGASMSSPASAPPSAMPELSSAAPATHHVDTGSSDDDDERPRPVNSFIFDVGGVRTVPGVDSLEKGTAAALGIQYTYTTSSPGGVHFAPLLKFAAIGSIGAGSVYDTHLSGGVSLGLGPLRLSPFAGLGLDGASGSDKYLDAKLAGSYHYGGEASISTGAFGVGGGVMFLRRAVDELPGERRYYAHISFAKYVITGQYWIYEPRDTNIKPEALVATWGFRF